VAYIADLIFDFSNIAHSVLLSIKSRVAYG
jgi:hypothetical protein